jgi:type II secretory pathway component PulF
MHFPNTSQKCYQLSWLAQEKKNCSCIYFPSCRAAVFVSEDDLGNLIEILTSVSDDQIAELQRQGSWLYEQYLSSIKAITLTTLDILNDRVFPQSARTYQDWNMPSDPVSAHIFTCLTFLTQFILLMSVFIGPNDFYFIDVCLTCPCLAEGTLKN